jgi:hypothetical protein
MLISFFEMLKHCLKLQKKFMESNKAGMGVNAITI